MNTALPRSNSGVQFIGLDDGTGMFGADEVRRRTPGGEPTTSPRCRW